MLRAPCHMLRSFPSSQKQSNPLPGLPRLLAPPARTSRQAPAAAPAAQPQAACAASPQGKLSPAKRRLELRVRDPGGAAAPTAPALAPAAAGGRQGPGAAGADAARPAPRSKRLSARQSAVAAAKPVPLAAQRSPRASRPPARCAATSTTPHPPPATAISSQGLRRLQRGSHSVSVGLVFPGGIRTT